MRLINRRPERGTWLLLAGLPFALAVGAYLVASGLRLAENPDDKLLPGLSSLGSAVWRVAVEPDKRTGDILLWADTTASLGRLLVALGIASLSALLVGVAAGLVPHLRALLAPFVTAVCLVPPLAVLPILFIALGLGEASKVGLIVLGITPFLIRDLMLRVDDLPRQQIIKAQTLGAGTWLVAIRVVVPQVLPRMVDAVRLSLGPAWLFLISAEAIAAESGLGYRIFLVRRFFAMDVILPYVAWITLLAFLMDWGLRKLQGKAFPWYEAARSGS